MQAKLYKRGDAKKTEAKLSEVLAGTALVLEVNGGSTVIEAQDTSAETQKEVLKALVKLGALRRQ